MKKYALALALAAGCSSPAKMVPTVSIKKPMDGSKFPLMGAPSVDVEVEFTVTNFTLIAPAGTGGVNQDGEGHAHLYVDDATNYADAGPGPLVAKGLAVDKFPCDAGSCMSGKHKLTVGLYNNDHTPVDGAMPSIVNIEVVQ